MELQSDIRPATIMIIITKKEKKKVKEAKQLMLDDNDADVFEVLLLTTVLS